MSLSLRTLSFSLSLFAVSPSAFFFFRYLSFARDEIRVRASLSHSTLCLFAFSRPRIFFRSSSRGGHVSYFARSCQLFLSFPVSAREIAHTETRDRGLISSRRRCHHRSRRVLFAGKFSIHGQRTRDFCQPISNFKSRRSQRRARIYRCMYTYSRGRAIIYDARPSYLILAIDSGGESGNECGQ